MEEAIASPPLLPAAVMAMSNDAGFGGGVGGGFGGGDGRGLGLTFAVLLLLRATGRPSRPSNFIDVRISLQCSCAAK